MLNATRTFGLLRLVAVSVVVLSGCTVQPPLPDDGYVNVVGGRVAFRVIGNARKTQATPLLVIHGGPGGNTCASALTLADIAARRPVIVYDQLGSGYSERINDLDTLARLPRFASEVTAIRNELGLDEIHLLGGSWGTAVAIEYLVTTEQTGVKSVTLVGPFVSAKQWLRDTDTLVARLSATSQQAIREAIANNDYSTPQFAAANDEFMRTFVTRNGVSQALRSECARTPPGDSGLYEYMWGPSEFIANGTLKNLDLRDRLHELNLPVLFIIGEHDEARPDTVREYQRQIAGSQLAILPDAGHSSLTDRPELFNRTLNDFLSKIDAGDK
ncbi:MAG: proline iminopeptidase-family hydrolase [Pseudomonadota bacterium]